MSGRRTNLGLLLALVVATVTGWAAFAIGSAAGGPVVIAHGVAGLAVVVLTPWKQRIARRGLRRRRISRWPGVGLSIVIVVTVVTGVLHAAGGRPPGGLTFMQVHVGAALAALPLVVWHVVAHPVQPRRTDLDRRSLLRAGTVTVGAAATWLTADGLYRLGNRPVRRFTGSHERGTDDPARMPVTQWLFDDVPVIDPSSWTLAVSQDHAVRRLTLDALRAHDQVDRRAVLDCTGGWYAEQTWTGVPLTALVDPRPGRRIVVTSATGYSRVFPLPAAADLLLAVAVAGAPLSTGHGAPARLVAPGRRGFWWVKWVSAITVDDVAPWRQPPFPLQ
ncbi:MAG TPA: molybdopterin-dependent oxidoreductase [Euzebyales bacterium]